MLNRQLKRILYLGWFLLLCHQLAAQVNPNATESTQKVYAFIEEIPNRSNFCHIIGQNLGHSFLINQNYPHYVEDLWSASGEWIGLIGGDYGLDSNLNTAQVNQVFIDYWNRGGMVTLSWHHPNPWTGGTSWDPTNGERIEELLDPTSVCFELWQNHLEKMADALSELNDAGVVVIWRPLHEMNGNWFWWGTQSGNPENYKALWRQMFNYFTYERGLNNLIWTYSVSPSFTAPVDRFYPGEDYVDIVGLDFYDDNVAMPYPNDKQRLLALGKPIAITEFGPSLPTNNGNYNYESFFFKLRQNFPEAAYVLVWHDWDNETVSLSNNLNADKLVQKPCIVTVGKLDFEYVTTKEQAITAGEIWAPNPFQNTLHLRNASTEPQRFSITNLLGETLFRGQLNGLETLNLPTAHWSTGTYWIVQNQLEHTKSTPIVKN